MNNLNGGQPTFNGAIPAEGPMAFQTIIKYLGEKQEVDLSNLLTTGRVSGIQTIYVDLNNFDYDVHIYIEGSAQTITAKKNTQGYYPILSTNLLKYIISADGLGDFNIQFINFPIALGVWGISEIKGDTGPRGPQGEEGPQGPQGEAGLNGIQIVENTSDGVQLYLESSPTEIKFKKLIAGGGIELLENEDFIEVVNTGGGGSGGATSEIIQGAIEFYLVSDIAANAVNTFEKNYSLDSTINDLLLPTKNHALFNLNGNLFFLPISLLVNQFVATNLTPSINYIIELFYTEQPTSPYNKKFNVTSDANGNINLDCNFISKLADDPENPIEFNYVGFNIYSPTDAITTAMNAKIVLFVNGEFNLI